MDDASPDAPLPVPIRARRDIASLSEADRRRLTSWVAEANVSGAIPLAARRRRRRVLIASTAAAALLVPWLVVLAVTLPERHRAHEWRLAWVGFDLALVAAFAATAWFGWRSRQIVVTCFVVTATLLLCDAWFDVVLSWGGQEQNGALAAALVGEIPFAIFLLTVYDRLLRAMTIQIWRDRWGSQDPPPLRKLPLLLRTPPADEQPA